MTEDRFHALCHQEIEVPDGWERLLEPYTIKAIYTDGGVIGINGAKGSPLGGTWAWCGIDDDDKRVIEKSGVLLPDSRYPELAEGVTNNHTEFYAVGNALRSLPDGWVGKLYTDSMVVVYRFQSFYQKKRKEMKNTPALWQKAFWSHCERLGKIEVIHVPGHKGVEHNEWCDAECTRLIEARQGVARSGTVRRALEIAVAR